MLKNYLSIFNFDHYILSLRKISEVNINDNRRPLSNIAILSFDDFTETAQRDIIKGLQEECKNKSYIVFDEANKKIDDFFENR